MDRAVCDWTLCCKPRKPRNKHLSVPYLYNELGEGCGWLTLSSRLECTRKLNRPCCFRNNKWHQQSHDRLPYFLATYIVRHDVT